MMSQPVLKTAFSSPGVSAAVPYQKGTVLSVDPDSQLAEVQFDDRRAKVSIIPRRGKGAVPAVGETWMLDQNYGSWMFAVLLSLPGPPDWIPSALLSPWVGAVSLLLDAFGVVRLRGLVTGGTASVSTAAGPLAADILQLPPGYLSGPVAAVFPVASNHAYGEVTVRPDGYVRASAGSVNWSLDPIAFPAQG